MTSTTGPAPPPKAPVTAPGEPIARRVEAAVGSGNPGHALRSGELRFVRTIAVSVGIQGPVAGVIVGPAVLAGLVGGSGALAYLLGLVGMGFVAYAFVVFSRSFNSAGSVYAFNGAALGPAYGFVSAWILLLVYVSFAGGVYASTADIAQTLFASFGVHLWWVWYALAGFALTMVFAWWGSSPWRRAATTATPGRPRRSRPTGSPWAPSGWGW
jgi:amino acid transporter